VKREKLLIYQFRALLAVFFIPVYLFSILFTRVFEIILRRALRTNDLDDVQRTLNWRGIKGVISMSRNGMQSDPREHPRIRGTKDPVV
jgi:hypothetical protein